MTAKTRLSLTAGVGLLLTPMLALAQGHDGEIPAHVVALAGMGMLMVLGIITIVFYFTSRVERARFDLIERLIARGERVPSDLFKRPNEVPPEEQRRRDFRRGIVLLAWGLGIGVVFYILSHGQLRAAAWSLIFLFLSGASFLNWYLADRHANPRERTHGA
jgi:uncharacterized protein DUF6249